MKVFIFACFFLCVCFVLNIVIFPFTNRFDLFFAEYCFFFVLFFFSSFFLVNFHLSIFRNFGQLVGGIKRTFFALCLFIHVHVQQIFSVNCVLSFIFLYNAINTHKKPGGIWFCTANDIPKMDLFLLEVITVFGFF